MWWNSSSRQDTDSAPGRVVDKRTSPPGVMPRHLQQWTLLGIAGVMITVLALFGSPAKPRTAGTAPAISAPTDANQQRIEEFQRRIQDQAQRLAAEQAQLELARASAGVPGQKSDSKTSPATADGLAADDHNRRPNAVPGSVDRGTREEHARFADNVAYSRERGSAAAAPSAEPAQAATSTPQDVHPSGAVPAPHAGGAPPPRDASPAPASSVAHQKYTLLEGTVIDTVLTNRLDGTFPGPVNCLVNTPVYASDQQHLVIPAGSRVLGLAKAVDTFGQSRLAVTFQRLVFPNGSHVDLNGFHGLNQVGDLGLHDQVDRHYAQIFGVSLAIGAIAGLSQVNTSVGYDANAADVYRQGAASSIAQSSARVLDRFLNVLPTITIREGHPIKVYLSSDLDLPEYPQTPVAMGDRP